MYMIPSNGQGSSKFILNQVKIHNSHRSLSSFYKAMLLPIGDIWLMTNLQMMLHHSYQLLPFFSHSIGALGHR